ncbi:MAG TPA: tripartite tricarboxylate transporter substrate binding protein [Anaeromyxobacter sp.]
MTSRAAKRILGLTASAAFLLHGGARAADEWPQRQPIVMVVPFAPGGASDFVARIIQPALSAELKQTIVIENKAGAAGNIGMDAAARAPADGYTLYLGNVGTIAINPSIFGAQLKVKPLADFIAVQKIIDAADVLVVNKDLPVTTVKEFVAYAAARKGQLNFGTPGAGSQNRLEMEIFMKATGLDMVHVPYKGGAGPAVTDLVGGQTQVMFTTLPSAMQFIKAGRLRALAVTLASRVPDLPNVPTLVESGYPDMMSASWQGVFVPKGTPAPIVAKLSAALQKIMPTEEIRQRLAAGGALVTLSKTPEEFAAYVKAETERWGAVVRERGITAN